MATQTIDATIFASSHPDIDKTYKSFWSYFFWFNFTCWCISFCLYF